MMLDHSTLTKSDHNKQDQEKTYPKKAFLPLTLGAALAVLFYVENIDYRVDFVNPYFYIALMVSVAIAALMIFIVYQVTLKLDVKYSWRAHLNLRLLFQMLFGLLLPLSIAFLFMFLYFNYFLINIFDTIWLSKYFPAISVLLMLFNLFFTVYWLLIMEPTSPALLAKIIKEVSLELKHEPTAQTVLDQPLGLMGEHSLTGHQQPSYHQLWPTIACIFCLDKHYFCINFTGELLIWPHNITNSLALLPPHQFVQLSRCYLINLNAIKAVTHKAPKTTYVQLITTVEKRLRKTDISDNKGKQAKVEALKRKTTNHLQQRTKPYLIKVSYDRKVVFAKALKNYLGLSPSKSVELQVPK